MRFAILIVAFLALTVPNAVNAEQTIPALKYIPECGTISNRTCLKQKALKILHRIAGHDLQAYFGFTPKIQIIGSKTANAFAVKDSYVFITDKLFENIQDNDLIAFVLLHEIAHLKLHNSPNKLSLLGEQKNAYDPKIYQEVEADEYACGIIKQEFNPELNCIKLLKKLGNLLDSGSNMEVRALLLNEVK